MTMPVYVIVPTNDRGKSVSRITVRTTPVTNAYIAGPKRDCAMIDADLSLESALSIARWAIANLLTAGGAPAPEPRHQLGRGSARLAA